MNPAHHYLLRAFSLRGRCPRASYWWRLVLLNFAFALFSTFFLSYCEAPWREYPESALWYFGILTLLVAAPAALLTLPLFLVVSSTVMTLLLSLAVFTFPVDTPPSNAEILFNGGLITLHALAMLLVVARVWVLSARRLRDAGYDPVYLIFSIIPLLGWVMAPIMLCGRSQPHQSIA